MKKFQDFVSETGDGSCISKILLGVVAPIIWGGIGLINIFTQQAKIPGRFGGTNMAGTSAVLWGLIRCVIAAFLNVHYFWTVSEKLWTKAVYAKIVISVVFVLLMIVYFSVCIMYGTGSYN